MSLHPAHSAKTCSSCGRELPLAAFHRRRHHVRSGRRAACKDCTREHEKRARAVRKPPEDPQRELKRKVREQTRQAIARGELVPPAGCSVCGAPHIHAHHHRYEGEGAYLDVAWLCPLHHAEAHAKGFWVRQLDLFDTPPNKEHVP